MSKVLTREEGCESQAKSFREETIPFEKQNQNNALINYEKLKIIKLRQNAFNEAIFKRIQHRF